MEVFDRLYAKFEADGHDLLISERNNGRLTTSGQPRINLRNLYKELFKTAEAQFVLVDQIRLLLLFAGDFYKFCEYSLAIECYEIVLQKCNEIEANSSNSNSYDNNYINNNSNSNSYGDSNSSVDVISTRYCVEATQQLVQANYHLLLQLKNVYISPMVVSQLLLCLKQLKNSIDKVYELTTRQQEEFAWQILNSCKLIYEIGQPLIWKSCGKYVAETLLYAATAMESVINLCTVRHIKFRMKLYSSVFYALLVQGVLDQATAVYEHADRQAKQLREREELDPPIPTTTILIMDQVDLDLAVMKATLDYWKLPEGLNLNDKHFASNNDKALELTKKTFTELVLLECIRVHMLSSGNKNENFRKRSTTIIKAINTDLQSYELPKVNEEQELAEGNAEEKDTAEPIELSPTAKKYTTEVLLELLSLVLFEVTEGVNGADLAAKLIALAKEHSTGMLSDSHRRCYQDIRLLTQVNSLINRQERDVSVEAITLQEVCDELESLMNSAESSRRKSFLNKIVFNLWNKYIYPILQAALSTNDSEVALKELKLITPTLQVVVNTTHVTGLEDPVLVACLSLLTANLLLYLDDPPGCIALLKKSIETIDEQRAARVDVELNMPEDVRDIYALQRQSFTTRSEAQDWFHSVKRLGAHAFAGFGIFGLSSTADRSDQALAEIHCDMLSVYFRVELDYAIHQKILKRDLKQKTLAMEQAAKAASTTVKTLAETSTKKKPKVLGTAGLGVEPDPNSFDMEKLNIYHTLKSYACRSSYHRCIFYMELARVEKETEKKKKCLVDAFKAIEEAEGREEALKESFADLVVMKEDVWTYPVVLARTNRYIYVCPVGNRAFSNAYYYRILAKDKGSGTDVSMFNTDIAGCEKKIYVSDLHHIKSNVVRIGPLRTGEQYVFGQAAFSQTDKAFGQVSPTTIPVEAVNPLPTVMLWAILNQVALEMNYKSISKNAAFRVCSRFFLTTPSLTPATIGKGINIFLAPEPALCMLAVQQASPIILQCFLNSFMSYESLTKAVNDVEHGAVYWQMRKSKQLKVLVTVHRIAVVATIACAISNHDLVVKCVLQGHDFSMELLAYDTPHLAYTLQNPLTVFVIALQSIAKKNWRSLEHKLYCKLFSILIKLSVINRNIQPVLSLLNSIYLEVDDKEAFDLSVPPQELFVNYLALYEVACQCINPKHLTEMSRHMIAVLSNAQPDKPLEEPEEDAPGKFWQLHYIGRTLQLRDKALTIVTSGQEVLSSIQEKPKYLSQLLQVVVQLGRELANGSNYSEFHQLLEKVPLYEEYLSPAVRGVTSQWELKLLQPLSNRLVATVDAKISKKTPNKGKTPKKGEEVVPDGPDPRLLVPDRFINCSAEEETAQLSWLSELIYICANCLYPKANQKTLNCFPQSTFGPELQIDPKTFAVDFEKRTVMGGIGVIEMLQSIADEGRTLTRVNTAEKLPSTDEDTAAGTILSPRKVEILDRELTRAEYIRYIGASIEAFGRSHRSYSAVYVTSKLWDLIISEWLDPVEFAIEFKDIRSLLLQVVVVIVNSLELVAFNRDAYSELSKLGEFTMATEAKDLNTMTTIVTGISGDSTNNTREMQELLAITNNLLIYLIKVLWLYNYYKEVVSLGGRIFQLISEISKDLCKSYGNHCLPLICHAQETLTDRSKDALAQKESDLQKFVFDYEEAQKKKRKKKVRIARTEKDEEELLFDAEKEVYQRKIDAANVVLNDALILLGKVQLQQQAFDTLYSTGSQLLGKVRKLSQEFLKEISSQYGDNVNYLQLGQVEAVQDKLEMIDDQFAQVCNYLREKKERLILIEALKEQGDLLLLFGKVHEAKSIWNDAVDGLFNRIDSCTEWYSICQNVVPSFDDNLVIGIIPTIVVLGKLSKYCASGDLDMKSGLARMAAKLIEVPFSESYGHPQTKYGYAAYECVELGGVMSLSMNDNLLTMQGIVVSLGELIDVMIYEKYYLDALPLVVLFEHIAIFYLRCARTFLDARLKRIKLLLCQHMFAEAAAMLAGIKNTILKVKNHSIVDLLRDRTNTATEDLKKFETSSNGLNFYGYEPFYNNKLPVNVDEEGNINGKALDWIAKFPADFREFSKAIVISLPIPVLSEEQLAAEEARKAAEAELASKAKGKKATKVIDTDASQSAPTRELLTPYQHLELSLVCGELLKEIGMLDNKVSNKYASSLKAIGDNSAMLFTSTLSELHSYYGSDKLSLAADLTSRNNSESPDEGNPYSYSNQCEEWIRLYCRCLINQYQYLVHQRNYKIARASISQLLLFLSSDSLATVSGDLRMVLAQTWLESKYLLIVISSCQARLEDAIDIATVSSKEASQMMCGYWLRMYIFERSRSYWKLGLLEDALSECNIVLKLYETSKYELSHRLRCMCFKATLLRERSLYEDRIVAVRMYIESLEILRLASSLALTTAHYVGAYPADSNICYERQDQMISRNDMLPPALFNLTTLHNNEPELTKYATHDLKALHISYGIDLSPSAAAVTANAPNAVYSAEATSTVHSSASITSASVTAASVAATSVASSVTGSIISMAPDGKATHEDVWLLFDRLRLAPVDSNPNVYTPSEYANIYLTEVRTLITINVALCICIDDIIGSGACNRSVKRAANKAKGTAKISTSKLNILNLEHLLVEQTVLGESSLKLCRQCIFVSPQTRIQLLLLVGKTRIAKSGMKYFDDPQNLMKILFEPFSAALQIAIDTSAHPWQLMNDICVQYVEAFGDHALDFGDDNNSSRLKWASLYLLNAIKIKKQHSLLARNTVALSNELDFLTAPDEELMKIIVGCSSSSATKKKGGDLVEEVQADDPKAEKKDKAKVATTGPPKLDSPNGRDGLYLLVSLLRECDNIWTDTMEQNLCIDMNYLFKSKYSSFSKLCLLAVPPSTNEELTVPIGSVSTLWRATKAPDVMQQEEEEEDEADLSEEAKEKLKTLNTVGLYSYCAVFFLLGDKSKSVAESEVSAIKGKPGKGKDIAAPVVEKSKEPVLTKLVLPRFEVVKFEKRLRRLKDQYVDAEAKKQVELITVYNTQLAELLMSMRSLVKHGSSSASIAVSSENGYEGDQYSIAEKEGESGKVLLSIPSLDNPKHLTTVTISTDFIQHLADVFCVDVATECLVNNDICCLVRDALGFVG